MFALYTNEMIKISRKVSTIVILSIMIVGVVGFGCIMKIQETYSSNNNQTNNGQMIIENNKSDLSRLEEQLANIESQIKNADATQLANLEQEKESITSQIEISKIAIEKDIPMYSNSYRARALGSIGSSKITLANLKKIPAEQLTDENKKTIAYNEDIISRFGKVIDNKDFKEYINISNDMINNDLKLSAEEKSIPLESNALRLKLNLTGDENNGNYYQDSFENSIRLIENAKRSLLYNLDYTTSQGNPASLSPEKREIIKNDLAVNIYKVENKISSMQIGSSPKSIAVTGMSGIGLFMITILIMILAGGAVSQELSSGSIKSLIISPAKRWKIFIAKVMSLLTIGIIASLILYIVTILTNGFLFGFSSGSPYIFATSGVAHELNFYLYQLFNVFINFIDVIVYMMLALMLSVITRNTAVSVGITIALYFGGTIANTFVLQFAKGEWLWLKFMPFSNLGLTTRIFSSDAINQAQNGPMSELSKYIPEIPINFSLCYIAVILICMGYIALDSFNRRDIK